MNRELTKQFLEFLDQSPSCYHVVDNLKKELLGEKDFQVSACLMSLGNLYEKMEKDDEALRAYQDALEIRRENRDAPLSSSADTYTAMGKLFEKQKKYTEAALHVQEALKLRKEGGDKDSGMLIWNMHLLAEIYRRQEQDDRFRWMNEHIDRLESKIYKLENQLEHQPAPVHEKTCDHAAVRPACY